MYDFYVVIKYMVNMVHKSSIYFKICVPEGHFFALTIKLAGSFVQRVMGSMPLPTFMTYFSKEMTFIYMC